MTSLNIEKNLSSLFNIAMPREFRRSLILKVPLKKRLNALLVNDEYLKLFNDMKEFVELAMLDVKKKNIMSSNKSGHPDPSKITLTEAERVKLSAKVSDIFIKNFFSKEEHTNALDSLFSPEKTLSYEERGILKICLSAVLTRMPGMDVYATIHPDLFRACLNKNEIFLENLIGETLKDKPRSILKYGLGIFLKESKTPHSELSQRADQWVASWLDVKQTKALLSAIPEKEKKGSQKEVNQIRRHQHQFQTMLLNYLTYSPDNTFQVFGKILPLIEKANPVLQDRIWNALFQKLNKRPESCPKISSLISEFLKNHSSKEAGQTFYHAFVKDVPAQVRALIIGEFSPKVLKKYARIAEPEKSFIHARIKTENGEEYLKWHLFDKQEISLDEMYALLKKLNLEKDKAFIFADKKGLNQDLFCKMAEALSGSHHYFWRWVKSFEKVPGFKEKLAKAFPSFSDKIKKNKLTQLSMCHHFDLVHQCALLGDTGSLSLLKTALTPNDFWHQMTQTKGAELSGIESLCHQGKRGLLKLMADLPESQQQALFFTPDVHGKNALSYCPSTFLRMVEENVFKRPYIKEEVPELPPEGEKVPSFQIPTPQKTEKKPKYQRQVFRLPYFEKSLERIQNNPDLLSEVESAIQDLRGMSGAEIQQGLREGCKKNDILKKLAVKDIRGNQYRLGYFVRGDADANQGKIAFLFLWTHAQYDNFLNKKGPKLIKQACHLMNKAPCPAPLLPNPGNTGR